MKSKTRADLDRDIKRWLIAIKMVFSAEYNWNGVLLMEDLGGDVVRADRTR